jgi:hypothetical protein
MSNVFDEFAEQPKKRTTFITVLCILTFVGSGFSLFTNIYGYFTAKQSAEQMQLMQKMTQSDSAFAPRNGKATEKDSLKAKKTDEVTKKVFKTFASSFTEDNIRKNSLGAIAAAILCLSGAVLMFMINKKGYFIYVAGTLLGIAIPLVLYGSNFVGIMGSVISGFFGLVFCILYGVNLKDMR